MTDMKRGQFIDYIGGDLKQKLRIGLSKAKLYGVLCGSTDSSVIEQEVVYLTYFDPEPTGSDEVAVKTSFIGVKSIKNASALGVQDAITDSYKQLLLDEHNIESFHQKLICFHRWGLSKPRKQTKCKDYPSGKITMGCVYMVYRSSLRVSLKGFSFQNCIRRC